MQGFCNCNYFAAHQMIELTNGEISLRPLTSADGKQWRRVRAINREWLEEWEATVPKTAKNDGLKGALSFRKMVRAHLKETRAGRSFSFGIFKGPNFDRPNKLRWSHLWRPSRWTYWLLGSIKVMPTAAT
jgi:hypothetical protein